MYKLVPIRFINEVIEVQHAQPLLYAKTPTPPKEFIWQEKTFFVKEILLEWKDFDRRGKSSHNMRPSSQLKAAKRGSRGVGRFHYQVLTQDDQVFQLYFDRSSWDQDTQTGEWILHADYAYRLTQNGGE
jgi:hypothetical protein